MAMGRAAPPPAPARPQAKARVVEPPGALGGRVREAATGSLRAFITWIGRVVLVRPGEVVIEIAVTGDATLAWDVTSAVVSLTTGGTVRLSVDEGRTTRAGTYTSGAVIRVVLQVPIGFDEKTLKDMAIGSVSVTLR